MIAKYPVISCICQICTGKLCGLCCVCWKFKVVNNYSLARIHCEEVIERKDKYEMVKKEKQYLQLAISFAMGIKFLFRQSTRFISDFFWINVQVNCVLEFVVRQANINSFIYQKNHHIQSLLTLLDYKVVQHPQA